MWRRDWCHGGLSKDLLPGGIFECVRAMGSFSVVQDLLIWFWFLGLEEVGKSDYCRPLIENMVAHYEHICVHNKAIPLGYSRLAPIVLYSLLCYICHMVDPQS